MRIEQAYLNGELETATPLRRLGAYLIDGLIVMCSFGIGWFLWSLIVSQYGQTPGKQATRLYIMRDDGTRAGGWYTLLREEMLKGVLFPGLSLLSLGVIGLLAPLWLLWDGQRQALWDKVASTHVAYSPTGWRPPTKRMEAEFRKGEA